MSKVFKITILFILFVGGYARNFRITNRCSFPVWPGWHGQSSTPGRGGSGQLNFGSSVDVDVPNDWTGGRVWARTGCDKNMNCETGGCGNSIYCDGKLGEIGVSLAEVGLTKYMGMDFYDVSLVDGFNVQIQIRPMGGEGDCKTVGKTTGDILGQCPNELRKNAGGRTVECRSACTVFHKDEYCCRGIYQDSCGPTNYSRFFKDRCPTAYSYPKDDATSCVF
uniref:Thaumatin-like protein n=1 Tax=Panagrolaimus sp. JU765 TaxID=591449 RepID=A0AC34Q7S0_9BILA